MRLSFERFMKTKRRKTTRSAPPRSRRRPIMAKVARARSADAGDITSKPMLIGYARVSTVDQNLALQRDALAEAGCQRIFTEQMSGAIADRPALHDALEFARSGDTLIVWKLDRLARSMKQLIETVETLRVKGYRVAQPDRSPRHDDRTRAAGLSHVWRARGIRAESDPGAHSSGSRGRPSPRSHGRASPETHRGRPRGCHGDARQSRHRRDANRASPRGFTRYSVSLSSRRANREHPRRLRQRSTVDTAQSPARFNGSSRPRVMTCGVPQISLFLCIT